VKSFHQSRFAHARPRRQFSHYRCAGATMTVMVRLIHGVNPSRFCFTSHRPTMNTLCKMLSQTSSGSVANSGRCVKKKQWELRRAKRKLVSGYKLRGRFRWGREYCPRENVETVYAKSRNLVHFCQKMVCNVVHSALLNSGAGTNLLRE